MIYLIMALIVLLLMGQKKQKQKPLSKEEITLEHDIALTYRVRSKQNQGSHPWLRLTTELEKLKSKLEKLKS